MLLGSVVMGAAMDTQWLHNIALILYLCGHAADPEQVDCSHHAVWRGFVWGSPGCSCHAHEQE